jgi:hypothetical protein
MMIPHFDVDVVTTAADETESAGYTHWNQAGMVLLTG